MSEEACMSEDIITYLIIRVTGACCETRSGARRLKLQIYTHVHVAGNVRYLAHTQTID